jgi:hypothetical protein
MESTVVVGRETFRQAGSIRISFGLSSHLAFDLLPNPDFSLVALGYRSDRERLQLDSPRRNYIRAVRRESTGNSGVTSREGWRAWLVMFSVSDHKKILSQEAEASDE